MGQKLVIAHLVVSDAFAGVERYVSQVAPELASRGHQVVVIGGDPKRMADAMNHRVEYRGGATSFGGLRSLVTRHGIDGINVIHAHMTKSEVVGAFGAAIRRCPVIATRHFGHGRGVPGFVDWFIRSRMSAELAVSEHVARTCPTTTDTVVSGVDSAEQVAAAAKVVLVAQRLEGEKHTADAIAAWSRSALADDGWHMAVAGVGAQAGMLADLAKRLGVESSVRFAGFVSDMAGARVGAGFQIATTPNESFGLSVAEAMAAGLPVIAAAGGGHLELLAGSPELLYPPGDVDALAAAMVRLAADVDQRRSIGSALRTRQRAHFTLTAHVDGLERVYQRVVR
jgi:glycosyltransferase involved in cell wall biosynthesis